MKKLLTLTLVLTLSLAFPAQSSAQLFFPTLVFDPSVNASIGSLTTLTTTNQIQQILNQIEQIRTAVDTYLKLKDTYELASRMAEYLKGLDTYSMAFGNWQNSGGAVDLFDTTQGIQAAMSGHYDMGSLGRSYNQSIKRLNNYDPPMVDNMNPMVRDRLTADAASVAIADSASQQALAMVASVGGAAQSAEGHVRDLVQASMSDAPELNTYAALLNRINVAAAFSLATGQDTNKLLSTIANSQAVLLKHQRDRNADDINRDIYLRRNFRRDWQWAASGANEAYRSTRISDYVRF
ncbi:MAG: hypothetical protein AB1898_31875 [Acidobacteriota bacterium]